MAAAAAAVWLGLSLASERLERDTLTLILSKEKISSAAIDDGLAKARRARRLQPDAAPRLGEWALLTRGGRPREAESVLEQVVFEEPANAQAWLHLTKATRDPRRASQARRRFQALQPR